MTAGSIFGFDSNPKWGEDLAEWHLSLNEEDRGARAALRKCRSPLEVVFVPAYHTLFHKLADRGKAACQEGTIHWNWNDLENRLHKCLPAIAGLLALIGKTPGSPDKDADRARTTAQYMALAGGDDGGPRVSDLRFRRLLRYREVEKLYPALRRVIRLLKITNASQSDTVELYGRPNSVLYTVANDLLWWSDERRKQWAYEYYRFARTDTQ